MMWAYSAATGFWPLVVFESAMNSGHQTSQSPGKMLFFTSVFVFVHLALKLEYGLRHTSASSLQGIRQMLV